MNHKSPNNLDLPLTAPEQESDDGEVLRRALIKISFAGSGVHAKLDKALEQLRVTIKKKTDVKSIQTEVENITNVLREIDDETNKRQELLVGLTAADVLTELVKQDLPVSTLGHLGKIRIEPDNPAKFAKQIAHAFLSAPAAEKQSIWSRWFGAKADSETHADASAPIALREDDVVSVTDDMLQPLLRLMDNLKLPEKAQAELRRLKSQAGELRTVQQLSDILENLSSLVLDASAEEQAQFELFLKQISERLVTVEEYLKAQGDRNAASLSDTSALNEAVRSHVQTLKQDVQDATDLTHLQQSVQTRLDNIVGSVDRFRDAQLKRQQTSEGEVKRLREQLRQTETEAEQLRDALREQRSKASTDALTQLPNRHAYHERLHQEYARWRRYRGKLTLVICDIDHFKRVNDTHGHLAGDAVLKHVSNILKQGIRESDFVGRFGGEEFVLLMPETSLIDATKAVNKIRQKIAAQSITVERHNIAVTVSFGVSEFEGDDVPRDVFERADRALYRAKTKGRNQVNCERKSGGESDGT